MSEAIVYDALRTPRGKGKQNGSLHEVKPVSLVTGLIDALRERQPNLDVDKVDDMVLGCVTPVGDQGACIAKTVLCSGCAGSSGSEPTFSVSHCPFAAASLPARSRASPSRIMSLRPSQA